MVSFYLSLIVLIAGYFIYGTFTEKVFGIDPGRRTPALTHADGIDYIPLPWWKIFLIQFLNIAGLGPIFGAIMGIMFGPAAFLWIVFGTLLGGAVHDYMSGMLSIRRGGASLPEIIGEELGTPVKHTMRGFSVLLMILVGAVFVAGPAELLTNLTRNAIPMNGWITIIFIYYILATLLPIDKLIGKLYPLFGLALLFMAVGILFAIIFNRVPVPEITSGLQSRHPAGLPVFPMMFISIACGAISGFHATQSPLMARCLQNEKLGRRVFYGAMVAEGIVALIWAAAASGFFGSLEALNEFAAAHKNNAAVIVDRISKDWLGVTGGILAMLGVIAAPLTSGDTALRSARLIVADFLQLKQKSIRSRLVISVPVFILAILLLQMDFSVLWRYFAWCNQTLAVFTLWAVTVYLAKNRKFYWISLLPALFMTAVSVSYILYAPEGLKLSYSTALAGGAVATLLSATGFSYYLSKRKEITVPEIRNPIN